jgi:LuxR family transcriptional regulator, maltose regulon positive regulatory protein
VQRAERTVRPEAEPATGLAVCYIRGVLELARGRAAEALAAFRAAERLAGHLATPHLLVPSTRAHLLYALVRLGETERAEQVLANLGEHDRERGEIGVATAVLRLAQDDLHAATTALAPVLDGSAPVTPQTWLVEAFLVQAIAQGVVFDRGRSRGCGQERCP